MKCHHNISLSPDWVQEKLQCINPTAMQRANQIRELIQNKFSIKEYFLTPNEFAKILVFKGAARAQEQFLNSYNNTNEVENTTRTIFDIGLNRYSFNDTEEQIAREDILNRAATVMRSLIKLKYVGIPVVSATLTLAFPHLFGTVDYIVPGILHCIQDDLRTKNPFHVNLQNHQRFRNCLLLDSGTNMTPKQTRELAIDSYSQYIQELWNIKRQYELGYIVADIEVSLWSFGICYLKKQKEKGKPNDNLPFRFENEPNPPRGGLFAKNCPNDF